MRAAAALMLAAAVPAGAHPPPGRAATVDSAARLSADVRALPGVAGYGIFALGEGAPRLVAGVNADAAAPIASAFKLWLLAEASREVEAGERRWSDVVEVGTPSLPSGVLQSWPAHAPVTLQTLATLMISISDNTAADTMLALLGRERVDALVQEAGAADPRTTPVLSTREAFLIKSDPALAAAWARGSLAERRRLLGGHAAAFAAASLSLGVFRASRPLAIDSVEWFASPVAMARLLDRLRTSGDATARAILAVNAGTDAATAARFGYVGFKGGSEPGVIAMNYLVRTKDGRWWAVTGNWRRTDADTPAPIFSALMSRALALAAG